MLRWYIHYTAEEYLENAKGNINIQFKEKDLYDAMKDLTIPLADSVNRARNFLMTHLIKGNAFNQMVNPREISDVLTAFKYGGLNNLETLDPEGQQRVRAIANDTAIKDFQEYFKANYLQFMPKFNDKYNNNNEINLMGYSGFREDFFTSGKGDAKMLYESQLNKLETKLQEFQNILQSTSSQGRISQQTLNTITTAQNDLTTLLDMINTSSSSIPIKDNNTIIDRKIPMVSSPAIKNLFHKVVKAYNSLVASDQYVASTGLQGYAFEDFLGILGAWMNSIPKNLQVQIQNKKFINRQDFGIVGANKVENPTIEFGDIFNEKVLQTVLEQSAKEAAEKAKAKTGKETDWRKYMPNISAQNYKGKYGVERKKYSYSIGKSDGTIDVEYEWPIGGIPIKLNFSAKNWKSGLDSKITIVDKVNLLSLLNIVNNNSFVGHYVNLSSYLHTRKTIEDTTLKKKKQKIVSTDDIVTNTVQSGVSIAGDLLKEVAAVRGLMGIRDNITHYNNSKLAQYFVVDDINRKRIYVFPVSSLVQDILQNEFIQGVSVEGLLYGKKIKTIFDNSWVGKSTADWASAKVRNAKYLAVALNQKITAKIKLSSFLQQSNILTDKYGI